MYTFLLTLHILFGSIALGTGLLAFTAPKGRKLHNNSGKLYTLAMLCVAASAFVLSLIKFNPFLFIVGLFSAYMTLTGYRATKINRLVVIDAGLIYCTAALLLLFLGILGYRTGFQLGGFLPVLITFVGVLSGMLTKDYMYFQTGKEYTPSSRLRRHISRMGGAYIATVTAFVVTNLMLGPVYIKWLAPGALGTLVILWFQRRYSPKKKKVRLAA